MKKVWDKSVWFCEAEYLSAKWRASYYQGSWLLVQDRMEIMLQWYSDAVVKHISHHAEIYDKFRPEENHQKHVEVHGRFFKMPVLLPGTWDKKSNFKEN